MKDVIIYTDGAARGNPGPAAIAAIIKDKQGKTITTVSKRIGTSTNNQAEYRAVILGLEEAVALGARLAEVRSDSELVVRQILGTYRLKSQSLLQLYQQVKQLENVFTSVIINNIPREQNKEANDLAKRTLDLVRHINYTQPCQLIIKITPYDNEKHDISSLHRLISILRNFSGSDLVTLSIGKKDKRIDLKLSNIHVNYCYELRERLKSMLGKRQMTVKPLE